MIKVITWIDDGREEVTTVTATAGPAEPDRPQPFSWELMHKRFAERLHAEEREG